MTRHITYSAISSGLLLALTSVLSAPAASAHPAYQTFDQAMQPIIAPPTKRPKRLIAERPAAKPSSENHSYFTDRTKASIEKLRSEVLSNAASTGSSNGLKISAPANLAAARTLIPSVARPTAEAVRKSKTLAASASDKMAAHDYRGALRDLSEAIKLNPTEPTLWLTRGALKAGTRDLTGAEADITECIRLNPKDPDAFNTRGMVKIEQKNYMAALTDLNKSLKLNPNNADAYAHRATCKRALGDPAGADFDDKEFNRLKR